MNELPTTQVNIHDPFWDPRLLTNATVSIFHQWRQLELSGCIDNFRLAAGEKVGFREGWFFADSDAFKWLDAAARIYACWPSNALEDRMNEFIGLITRAQMSDGYLFTYNQIHFPGERWENLMIEHELYCHGHLIEAGVSHFGATGENRALEVAGKAADLLVNVFLHAGPDKTSGHEEVEIALLRLYQATKQNQYLELANVFLERRGRARPFAPNIIRQQLRVAQRDKSVQKQRKLYYSAHPEQTPHILHPNNYAKVPRGAKLRWALSALSGKYFQQHAPIRKQIIPVGHSVRFAYLETAIAMLMRHNGDLSLLPTLEKAWQHMVTRRMYITGGIGSLPELEGFGRDYELDPETAYAETCATLGSLYWNWEMALNTGKACYSDLFEWQLYNAAAVGMGLNGDSYLYNNPLLCRSYVARRPWFKVPCCPSNLSRTWAALGKYIYSFDRENLWIHQYIGNHTILDRRWKMELSSSMPWDGKVSFSFRSESPADVCVHIRTPSWTTKASFLINDKPFSLPDPVFNVNQSSELGYQSSIGYDPSMARFIPVRRTWMRGDVLSIDFEMPIIVRYPSIKLRNLKSKVVLTRGPIVYCLESVDNPGIDIFRSRIDPSSIQAEFAPTLLNGTEILHGRTTEGMNFTAIPYFLWANRGESQMTVWINV